MPRPPHTIAAYVVLFAVPLCVAIAAGEISAMLIVAALLLAALLVGLWRGSRFAWGALLALEVSALVSAAFDPSDWWWLVANVAGLVLLLVSPTRRHVWREPRKIRAAPPGASAV